MKPEHFDDQNMGCKLQKIVTAMQVSFPSARSHVASQKVITAKQMNQIPVGAVEESRVRHNRLDFILLRLHVEGVVGVPGNWPCDISMSTPDRLRPGRPDDGFRGCVARGSASRDLSLDASNLGSLRERL